MRFYRIAKKVGLITTYLAMSVFVNLLSLQSTGAQDLIYVARGDLIYDESGKNRRILIEPGTLLKFLGKMNVFPLGVFCKVRTPTGIEGTIPEADVEVLATPAENIAFVKRSYLVRGVTLAQGSLCPFSKVDDQGETAFELETGTAEYVVKQNKYIVRTKKIRIPPPVFERHFNVVTDAIVKSTSFPKWSRLADGKRGTPCFDGDQTPVGRNHHNEVKEQLVPYTTEEAKGSARKYTDS